MNLKLILRKKCIFYYCQNQEYNFIGMSEKLYILKVSEKSVYSIAIEKSVYFIGVGKNVDFILLSEI